jgi:hypothetical protein
MHLRTWTLLATLALTASAMSQSPPAPAPAKKPVVQIAILLDTSGSMTGLIDQAKTQLWKIVNEFAKGRRAGLHPDIQVALYHYGTPSLGAGTGYIKQLVPLTDDLDKVSEQLFALHTDGGDEYCGWVIQTATDQLNWSANKDAYKAIFIAGNEPFTQGSVDFRSAVKQAITKGIIVNTIFCGNEQEGINTFWKEGATLADGAFMSINQNAQIVHVDTPQDKELAELSAKINTTYVGYGRGGRGGAANQMAQDSNAVGMGGGAFGGAVAAERAVTKGSANYRNSTWDLVDAVNDKKVDLKDLKPEDLPEDMQKLDEKGRADYVAQKTKERGQIKARIQQLSDDRSKFLAEKAQQAPANTFDAAVLNTVHTQAKTAGMTFPDSGK